MTVFVIQKPTPGGRNNFTYDVTPAGVFGKIQYIFTGEYQPYQDTERAEKDAYSALAEFNDEDYLLWAGGDPAGLIIAGAVASNVNEGSINYLRWNKMRTADKSEVLGGQYVPINIIT